MKKTPGSWASRQTSQSVSSLATTIRSRWAAEQQVGQVAAPIFTDFVKKALSDKPPVEFRVPRGLQLIAINRSTGGRASPGAPGAILEAFKPGMAPNDSYAVIDFQSTMGVPTAVSTEAQRAVTEGTGGLY